MDTEYELLPCPFCGGKAELSSDFCGNGVYVRCCDCGVMSAAIRISAEYCANEKAVEKWNRRVSE